jgi:hypothetical protein
VTDQGGEVKDNLRKALLELRTTRVQKADLAMKTFVRQAAK